MHRREFIKQGCFACMALGAGVSMASLSSCSPLPVLKTDYSDGIIQVNPLLLPEGWKAAVIRTKKLENDILLVKNENETYHAVYLVCTHNNTSLSPTGKEIICTLHNGRFDWKGNVLEGPAPKKLRTFKVSEKNNLLVIELEV